MCAPPQVRPQTIPLFEYRIRRLANGSSYATHISPNASAPWLAQSCAGPSLCTAA